MGFPVSYYLMRLLRQEVLAIHLPRKELTVDNPNLYLCSPNLSIVDRRATTMGGFHQPRSPTRAGRGCPGTLQVTP